MGRPRSFDTDAVVQAARDAFVRGGYAGTSIDDLLRATGVQRASLYSAFGSKRGLFVAALRRPTPSTAEDLDLLLVALMELAASDPEVTSLAAEVLERLDDAAAIVGRRVLQRAGFERVLKEGTQQ